MRTDSGGRRQRLPAAALAALLTTGAVGFAADSADPALPPDQVQRRLKELEEQVDRLNRESRQHEVQIDNQSRNPLAQWKDGFVINSPDNRFKLKIGAYTQADGRFFVDDTAKAFARRARRRSRSAAGQEPR